MAEIKISLYDAQYRPTGSFFCDNWIFMKNDDMNNVALDIPQIGFRIRPNTTAFIYIQEQFRVMLYLGDINEFKLCEDAAQFDDFLNHIGPKSYTCQCKKKASEQMLKIVEEENPLRDLLRDPLKKLESLFKEMKADLEKPDEAEPVPEPIPTNEDQ